VLPSIIPPINIRFLVEILHQNPVPVAPEDKSRLIEKIQRIQAVGNNPNMGRNDLVIQAKSMRMHSGALVNFPVYIESKLLEADQNNEISNELPLILRQFFFDKDLPSSNEVLELRRRIVFFPIFQDPETKSLRKFGEILRWGVEVTSEMRQAKEFVERETADQSFGRFDLTGHYVVFSNPLHECDTPLAKSELTEAEVLQLWRNFTRVLERSNDLKTRLEQFSEKPIISAFGNQRKTLASMWGDLLWSYPVLDPEQYSHFRFFLSLFVPDHELPQAQPIPAQIQASEIATTPPLLAESPIKDRNDVQSLLRAVRERFSFSVDSAGRATVKMSDMQRAMVLLTSLSSLETIEKEDRDFLRAFCLKRVHPLGCDQKFINTCIKFLEARIRETTNIPFKHTVTTPYALIVRKLKAGSKMTEEEYEYFQIFQWLITNHHLQPEADSDGAKICDFLRQYDVTRLFPNSIGGVYYQWVARR
jgi:hypothetical protein